MSSAPRPTFASPEVDEALDYLDGVLASDRLCRIDGITEPPAYAPAAFWRGVIETAGSVSLSRSPRVHIQGRYGFLRRFLDWCEQNITGWTPGDYDFQASGGVLSITGRKAQDVCRALYAGSMVGLDSIQHTADEILQWTGKD